MDRLPPDQGVVMILSEIEGFKNREFDDIPQIVLDNVKIRLHRARASMKKLIYEECNFYHDEQENLACD